MTWIGASLPRSHFAVCKERIIDRRKRDEKNRCGGMRLNGTCRGILRVAGSITVNVGIERVRFNVCCCRSM